MRALITGITGQLGYYLAQHLHSLDYEVWGLAHGQDNPKVFSVVNSLPFVKLLEGDLLDQSSLISALGISKPDEVYNLAAISFVPISWKQPELTVQVTGLGVLRLLEAIRIVNKGIRFYQASSSEMFGNPRETPQKETTSLNPRSPYGVAKVFSHQMTISYRESYGLFACCGIQFNCESERRPDIFVTRKITRTAARIRLGLEKKLILGNLDARRDWQFAGDAVKAIHLVLQHRQPEEFVIASGKCHTVLDFARLAFSMLDLRAEDYIEISEAYLRPADVFFLCGDPSKAKELLGWEATTKFPDLVRMMVNYDLSLLSGKAMMHSV